MDEQLIIAGFNYLYNNQPHLAFTQFENSLIKKPDHDIAATGLVMALLESDKLHEAKQALEKFRITNNKPDSLTTLAWLISHEINDTEALEKTNTQALHFSECALLSNIKNLPAKVMARVLLLDILICVNPTIRIWIKTAIEKGSPEAEFMLAGLEIINGNFAQGFNYLDKSKKAGVKHAFFFDTYLKIAHLKQTDAEEEKKRAITLATETIAILNSSNQFFGKKFLQACIDYLSGNISACMKTLKQLHSEDQGLGIIYAKLLLQRTGSNEDEEKEAFAIIENVLAKKNDGPPLLIVLLIKILAHQNASRDPVLSLLQTISNFFKARLLPSFGVSLTDFFHPAILEKVRKKYPSDDLNSLIKQLKVTVDAAPLFSWKPVLQQITQIIENPPQPTVFVEKKAAVKTAAKKQSAATQNNLTTIQTPSPVGKSSFFAKAKRKAKEVKAKIPTMKEG